MLQSPLNQSKRVKVKQMSLKAKNLVGQYNFIMVSRPLMAYFKDANILMMMHALIEGDSACSDDSGWFYQTVETIEDMYFLSRKQQDRVISYLIENEFIYKKVTGLPARRYFKINNEKLTNVMLENSELLCNKGAFQYVQKGQTGKSKMDEPYINKEISNKEISNKDKAQSQAIDAPPPKKRNTVDWDWSDRIVERFGVTEQVAQDFITARKAKRALITETVLSHFQSEVKKVNDAGVYFAEKEAFAYWVATGWQGFKADWYLKGQQFQSKNGYKTKETIEDCMTRLSKSEGAMEELDVTPSKNGLGLPVFDDFDSDDPFAYYQKNNA